MSLAMNFALKLQCRKYVEKFCLACWKRRVNKEKYKQFIRGSNTLEPSYHGLPVRKIQNENWIILWYYYSNITMLFFLQDVSCPSSSNTAVFKSILGLAAKSAGFESSQMDWKKTECKQIRNCLLSSLLFPKNLFVYLFENGRKRNFLLFLINQTSWQMEKRFFCTNYSLPRKNQHTSISFDGMSKSFW